jgi:amino acid transporter
MKAGLTPTRIAAGILVALMALSLAVPAVASTYGVLAYFGLVAIAMVVVSGVRKEPGSWLGRRSVRRGVVVLLVAVCVGLLATPLPTFNPSSGESGAGPLLELFAIMILLNIALGRATQRVASAPQAMVDERQEALRNRAYRFAYLALLATVGGVLLVSDLAGEQSRAWLGNAVRFNGWLVFGELLFVLPTMVLAFIEPDRVAPEPGEVRSGSTARQRAAGALLALSFGIPVVLSVLLAALPPSVSTSSSGSAVMTTSASGGSAPSVNCRHFQSDLAVGRGIQADIPVNAVACWNGRSARASYGMAKSDCNPGDSVAVDVTTLSCSSTTLPDGTLTFTYRARVSSSLLPFLGRTVMIEVSIDKNGHVLAFP